MTDSEEKEFKPISRAFFEKEWQDRFDIFYEVPIDGRKRYIKFAEYDPADYSRLDTMLQEKDSDTLFVKETDLYKYYNFKILKNLLLGLVQDKPPAREVFQRVYPVASRILQDYLELPASDNFLKLLDELPKMLVDAIQNKNLSLHELSSITVKDNSTHTHCVNVGFYCLCIGREMGMNREEQMELCLGGMLADIGKKYIAHDIMFKEGALTETELQAIRRHPSSGKKALNDLHRYSDTVLRMAGEHHENFDGSGYPLGYSGTRINYAARICKIMDVFNAMTCRRSYGDVLSPMQALMIMKEKMGHQFDLEIITEFIRYAGKQ